MKRLPKRLAFGATFAAVVTALVAGPSGSAIAVNNIPNCTPATNIEAIIDDSGSMSSSDPTKFRAKMIEILTAQAQNQTKTLGAVEFGSTANALFPPLNIGSGRATMLGSLGGLLADNGGTDFDLGFTTGNTANSTADARIFLSDGQADPPTAHLSPLTKTYVVGFADAATSAAATLQKIATDTNGAAFLVQTSAEVQAVAGILNSRLNCLPDPTTFVDQFTTAGKTKIHTFKPTGRTADVTTTWPTEGVVIVPSVVTTGGGGGKTATIAKVKSKSTRGTTFQSLHLTGLKKGKKVKVQVKAKTLTAPTAATTQIVG